MKRFLTQFIFKVVAKTANSYIDEKTKKIWSTQFLRDFKKRRPSLFLEKKLNALLMSTPDLFFGITLFVRLKKLHNLFCQKLRDPSRKLYFLSN